MNRIISRFELKAAPLSEDLKKILDNGVYEFTPENGDDDDDDENRAPVEARFYVSSIDIPAAADKCGCTESMLWNVLSAFERNDVLDIEVYRSAQGEFIVDLLIVAGGPTVRARYETRSEELTVAGSWGSDSIELAARRRDFLDTPLYEVVSCAIECAE